jgi:hypothetical protein
MISTTLSGMKVAVLAKMVEEGKLQVVVNKIIDFKDVLRVSQFNALFSVELTASRVIQELLSTMPTGRLL